jgi:hypothetical protein
MIKAILLNYSCIIQKKEFKFTKPFVKMALFVNTRAIKNDSHIIDTTIS